MKGRLQEMGSLLMRGNRADGRHVPDGEDPPGGPEPDRPHDDAGVRRLQLGRQSRRLRHAQSLEYRLHHLRLVGGQRRDGRGRRGADRACDRRRRFDPHSRRRQRQYRAEGVARRVLAGAALSDLTGLVSIQGCQSRSVRDTAAFVDACRGPAPGEFMPFWTSPQPYPEMIKRDPRPLRIALSHTGATIARRRRSPPSSSGSAASSKASAITSTTRCPRSTSAPPSRRRPPATSAISRW